MYGAILPGNDDPCEDFIGPLAEHQTFTPMVLNVLAQGQPTLMDKLNNIEHERIGKVDAMEGKVGAIEGKVDAMEGKVDAIEGKVDAMEGKVEEMKDIMKTMMHMMQQGMESSV